MAAMAEGGVFMNLQKYSIGEYSQRSEAVAKEFHPPLTGVVWSSHAETRIRLG